jgi:hypothetical protein
MDLLSFWNWLIAQLTQVIGSIPPSVVQWLTSVFASWNPGTPPPSSLPPADMAATPELGSLALLGSGLVAAGGYALTQFRARRRS